MAGEKTIAELVRKVRDLIKEFDQTPYRDGFTADAAEDAHSISIVSAINTAQRMLGTLGYIRERADDISTVAGTHVYTLDNSVIRVLSANLVLGDTVYPLRKMADRNLDIILSRGPSVTRARPREWGSYMNNIVVNPVPDAIYTLQVYVNRIAFDFEPDSTIATPFGLPSVYHEALAFGGALVLMAAEVENPSAQNRVPYLQQEWSRMWNELARETKVQPVPPVPMIESSEYGRPAQAQG